MFQFTTTNIINYDKNTRGEDMIVKKDGMLVINRIATFKPADDCIKYEIFKAVATEPQLETVDIDLSKCDEDKEYMLKVYIRLTEGSNFSLYANDTYYKGKPFVMTFSGKKVDDLEKTIRKYQLNYHGEKMFDVKQDTEEETLTLTAVNEYQRFATVQIFEFDPTAFNGIGDYIEVENIATVTPGIEGFGTYSWILHNLRIPTGARTGFMAYNYEETPIPGALYDQYTIHMYVDRGTLGMNAVGDQVRSHTTHVFYVNKDFSETFGDTLNEVLGVEITDVDDPQNANRQEDASGLNED